jgi:hypothetical protein
MRLRSRRKHHKRRITDGEHKEIGCATLNPEQVTRRAEETRLLHLAIDALPEKLRKVVEIKELQDRTAEEAASLLGISVPATKARLFRAKGLLKCLVSSKWSQRHELRRKIMPSQCAACYRRNLHSQVSLDMQRPPRRKGQPTGCRVRHNFE